MSKVVVITGASAGIGEALARLLAKRGHRVVLAARRRPELEAVAASIGANALAVVADVTSRADVERLRDEAVAHFGVIDVWINNAGRGITRNVLDLTDADIDEVMLVNVKSALYGMQTAVGHFKTTGRGHVINVSSFLARVPMASVRSVYSAAKAALNSLTTNLRMDLAGPFPGIQVSTVMPGIVATAFNANAINGSAPLFAPTPGNPMKPQTADEVAAVIAGVIDAPRPEVYTNPASPEVARKFFESIKAFE